MERQEAGHGSDGLHPELRGLINALVAVHAAKGVPKKPPVPSPPPIQEPKESPIRVSPTPLAEEVNGNFIPWGELEILNELGAGAYGVVYRVTRVSSGEHYAAKMLHSKRSDFSPQVR